MSDSEIPPRVGSTSEGAATAALMAKETKVRRLLEEVEDPVIEDELRGIHSALDDLIMDVDDAEYTIDEILDWAENGEAPEEAQFAGMGENDG